MSEDKFKVMGDHFQSLWTEFLKKCEESGMKPRLTITFQNSVVESMNAREKKLCEIISNTYLVSSITFDPTTQPETPAEAPKEEPAQIEQKLESPETPKA